MSRNPKIAAIPSDDKAFCDLVDLLDQLVAREAAGSDDFVTQAHAAMKVIADAAWSVEERWLHAATTVAPRIAIDGEPHRALPQRSTVVVHGRWGSHVVQESLYRREGVPNGPTVKPLLRVLGVGDDGLLPDFADICGELFGRITDRESTALLKRMGFRPPSRSTGQVRVGQLLAEMAIDPRGLEDAARVAEREATLDFKISAISCGLDRMSVRMDETLPDGAARDEKIRARAKRKLVRRPPEPYERKWRMAWTGSLTIYDLEGVARRTLRYAMPADVDSTWLAARVTDDAVAIAESSPGVPVVCIQDGAKDLEVLREALDERLPPQTRTEHVVDFHHAISYLDAVVANCEPPGDPCSMAQWYRYKLQGDAKGVSEILAQLARLRRPTTPASGARDSIDAAVRYLKNHRARMSYSTLINDGLPIGSGATESGCALMQLRVKHPGSHWRTEGLSSILNARALLLSGRWPAAYAAHRQSCMAEVRAL